MSETSSVPYVRLRDYSEAENGGLPSLAGGPPSLTESRDSRDVSSSPRPRTGLHMASPNPKEVGRPAPARQKKGRRMSWLILNATGDRQIVSMDKRQLIQVMGLEIPMRDMRLLDPALQTWETICQVLVRDNAMVVRMEYVRLIIMADKVIIPLDFEKTEQMERFVHKMEGMIQERAQELEQHRQQHSADVLVTRTHSRVASQPDTLPFELQMLEIALGEVCRYLQQQVSSLESLAHPALDALTRNANTVNLERVRKIKTQHQRLQGRVNSLREVLERYMEDDQDMWRMCLSKKREQDVDTIGSDNTLMLQRPGLPMASPASRLFRQHSAKSPPGHFLERHSSLHLPRDKDSDSSTTTADYHDLLEVENLLESYFMMVDSTHQKLAQIGEYIDDTEDYINIELDYSRNRLLKIEILLTISTFSLAIYNLVAGVLGENLVLPEAWTQDIWGFITINSITLSVVLSAFFIVWRIMRRKRLV